MAWLMLCKRGVNVEDLCIWTAYKISIHLDYSVLTNKRNVVHICQSYTKIHVCIFVHSYIYKWNREHFYNSANKLNVFLKTQ